MNDKVKEYAIRLGCKYCCEVNFENLEGMTENTSCYEIVKAALPTKAVIRWLKEAKKQDRELRQKYNLEPFDKFDSKTDEEIKRLEQELL